MLEGIQSALAPRGPGAEVTSEMALVLFIGAALVFVAVMALAAITPAGELAVRIAVTGYQWWWQVAYLTPAGEVDFVTANELRLPVSRGTPCARESTPHHLPLVQGEPPSPFRPQRKSRGARRSRTRATYRTRAPSPARSRPPRHCQRVRPSARSRGARSFCCRRLQAACGRS